MFPLVVGVYSSATNKIPVTAKIFFHLFYCCRFIDCSQTNRFTALKPHSQTNIKRDNITLTMVNVKASAVSISLSEWQKNVLKLLFGVRPVLIASGTSYKIMDKNSMTFDMTRNELLRPARNGGCSKNKSITDDF
jgi:hypothetical protein